MGALQAKKRGNAKGRRLSSSSLFLCKRCDPVDRLDVRPTAKAAEGNRSETPVIAAEIIYEAEEMKKPIRKRKLQTSTPTPAAKRKRLELPLNEAEIEEMYNSNLVPPATAGPKKPAFKGGWVPLHSLAPC